MTLEDKFRQGLTGQLSDEKTEVATKIAEDFALGFSLFISVNYKQVPQEPIKYVLKSDNLLKGKRLGLLQLLKLYKNEIYN